MKYIIRFILKVILTILFFPTTIAAYILYTLWYFKFPPRGWNETWITNNSLYTILFMDGYLTEAIHYKTSLHAIWNIKDKYEQ